MKNLRLFGPPVGTADPFAFALSLHKFLEFCLVFHSNSFLLPTLHISSLVSTTGSILATPTNSRPIFLFVLVKNAFLCKRNSSSCFLQDSPVGIHTRRTDTSLEGGYPHYSLLLRKQSCRAVPAILGLLVGLLPKELTLGRTPTLQSVRLPQPLHQSCCFLGFLWPEDLCDRRLLPARQEVPGMPWSLQMSPASKDKAWAGNPFTQGVGNVRALSLC